MENAFAPFIESDNNDICRACTKHNDTNSSAYANANMISLFDSNKNIVAEIYSQCTSIKLSESDKLPKNICHICHDKLILFNTFRLACLEAEHYFRNKVHIKNEKNDEFDQQTIQQDPEVAGVAYSSIVQSVQSRKRKKSKKSPNGNKEFNFKLEAVQSNVKEENNEIFIDEERKYEIPELVMDDINTMESDEPTFLTLDNVKSGIITKRRRKKQSNIFKCDLCKKKFFQKRHIEAHMRTHAGLKPYKCSECDKSFVKCFSLKVHIRLHHSSGVLPQFQCTLKDCGRSYARKQSLSTHIKQFHLHQKKVITNERRFTCETCGSSFRTNHSLQKHTFVHTRTSEFNCEICQKKYSTKYKLKIHMNRHNDIKNHICAMCGLRKATGHELRVHMNYHTREKQHQCKFCDKQFLSSGNMSRHIKIVHCGVKSYKCTHCDRSFGKPDTLKHHVMTHTGEKPHGCEVCGKRFIQLTALQTHRKTHR